MNKSDGLVVDSEGSYMLKLLDLVYGGGEHKPVCNNKSMQCNKTNSEAAKRSKQQYEMLKNHHICPLTLVATQAEGD